MSRTDSTKAERKIARAAARARSKGAYEDTPFGRRRVSKLPKTLITLVWLVGLPVLFIYRRLRRSSAH